MQNCYKTLFLAAIFPWSPFLTMPKGQAQTADTSTQISPIPRLLGTEYVDMRHGFTLRPPFGSEPTLGVRDAQAPSGTAGTVPIVSDWQILKIPESKELVRFADGQEKQVLMVYLLVTRDEMDIAQMEKARTDYWQKYTPQAALQEGATDTIRNSAVVRREISWKPKDSQSPGSVIHEAIIQAEKNRFFLLALLCSAEGRAEQKQPMLMDAVIKSFNCLDKQEQKLRWQQARKRAQQFLENLDFTRLRVVLEEDRWYRIKSQGEDIGFGHIVEQWVTQSDKSAIKITWDSFIKNAARAADFAQIQGWGKNVTDYAVEGPSDVGAVRLTGTCLLPNDMKSEEFDYQIYGINTSQLGYHEKGVWTEKKLSMQRCDDPQDAGKSQEEILEVNDKLYLPWTQAELLTRLLEIKISDEYVFLRYHNRSLQYYSLRVAGSTDLKLAEPGKSESSNQEKASQSQERPLKTFYLIGQTGPEGPIVHMWVDEKGRLLKQLAGGITLLRSSAENIKELWPEATKVTPTKPSGIKPEG